MLAIKNNIMAVNAARYLGQSYDALAKSVERLSSGLRINSAKDDAAGLAVRELMRADIAVLEQGARNAQDGISMVQTMEGAMATIDTCLVRMKQLAEQAATGSYSSAQRVIMNAEFAEMAAEVERIATATKFNDITMLDNTNAVSIQFGSSTDAISVSGADMRKSALGIETGTGITSLTSTGHVADAGAAGFFTYTDSGAGTEDGTLTLQFIDNDDSIDEVAVTVTFEDGDSLSLNDLVDRINTASQNLGNDAEGNSLNYAMASVYHDDDTGENYLKLSSREGGVVDDMTAVMTSAGTAEIGGTGGFVTEADLTTEMGAPVAETGINILDTDAANTALTSVTSAITDKDAARAAFGYKMNRLESSVSVLNIQAENLKTSESRISDVDVATEMAELTRNQVLSQAGTAMLAQANAIPQMALTLLR